MNKQQVEKIQVLLNRLGNYGLVVDGDFGQNTEKALDSELNKQNTSKIPWYMFAKKYEGKKETDPEFNKEMSAKWSLVGLNLGTISKNWAAWCGLAMAVALSGVGLSYRKDGASARNWAKYGTEINWKEDGIPRGAIIHINHAGNCSSGTGNHVTLADGDCAAEDLLKNSATFNGYGGNQGNTWKVSSFVVSEICAVRWPPEYPKPGKILKSDRCSGANKAGSTR